MGRKKRVLEFDEERVSPPHKMSTRSINGAGVDEIMAKLDSIEERFKKLELEMAEITKVMKDFEVVKQEVEGLKETCSSFQRLELEQKKRSVLVRGLMFKSSEKYETRTQTKAALAEFFARIGLKPHLVDYQRLGGRRADEDGSKISVRIQFMDTDQKLHLFEKLKEHGRELHDINILTDYPNFQLQEFKRLSGIGYELRKAKPGTKTRVVSKGLGLALQSRTGPSDRWTSVS
jgi:hypothetical protein